MLGEIAVVGAPIAAAGGAYIVGRVQGYVHAVKKLNTSTYQCRGCKHPLTSHRDQSGSCVEQQARPHYLKSGSRNGREYVTCPCLAYVGDLPPKPIDYNDVLFPKE